MRGVFVVAKVLAVRNLYAYPCCSICHRKVRRLDEVDPEDDEKLWCSYCKKPYKKKSVQYCYHVNLTVADKSGFARVTVFGKSLEAFFGLTATKFCRYVVNCGGNKSLENICIDQIVHLAMEKCFLGSMVRLVFPVNASCNTNQANTDSPVVLHSVIHLPTKTSKISGLRGFRNELLASYIIRIKNENRTRMIIDIFIECIDCVNEKSCLSDEKRLSSFKTDDTVGECSINCTTGSELSYEQTCSHINEVETLLNSTGINLVLSMMSNDDESRDGIILRSSHTLDEMAAEYQAEDVADSASRLCDDFKEETSSNFMKKTDLSSLQQSFLCSSDSNSSQVCTSSITEHHTDKFTSSSTNVNSSAVANDMTLHSKCSELKKFPSLRVQVDCIPDSSSKQDPVNCQREANCMNIKTFLDGRLSKCVDPQTIVSCSGNCETFLANPSVTPHVCDSSSDVKFESMFDSLASEDLHACLAQFDYSHSAGNLNQGNSTPELFSPSEVKQTSQSSLSSTPHLRESTLLLRRTKHVGFKSDHNQGKKISKTLWKYMKGMGKDLLECPVTPKDAGITSDEKLGNREVSPLLFSDNSPEWRFRPDNASTPITTLVVQNSTTSIGNESFLFESSS